MAAIYAVYTSPNHPPIPNHLPTLIVTPHGQPTNILYSYLHTNFNTENYLLTPSPQGDLCVAKLYPPRPKEPGKGSASDPGHGSSSSSRVVRCEASRNLKWSIANTGVISPIYKLSLPSPDSPDLPLFQISKPNPNAAFWSMFYFAYAGHNIPPKRIEFGKIQKNPPGPNGTGGGTRISITGKTPEEKAVWQTLGEGNEDCVEWVVLCAALNLLDDEIIKAAEKNPPAAPAAPRAPVSLSDNGPVNRNGPPPPKSRPAQGPPPGQRRGCGAHRGQEASTQRYNFGGASRTHAAESGEHGGSSPVEHYAVPDEKAEDDRDRRATRSQSRCTRSARRGQLDPISPVVMGFTLPRDNPKEIEQVKSLISVKQKQKALIEQRRGSLAAPAASNPGPPPSSNESTSSAKGQPGPLRGIRRSPNGGASSRRVVSSTTGPNRAPSPNVSTFQMQQQTIQLPHQSAQTLPPPPISFARRRAAQLGKRKPADIVINPRERVSPEHLQPMIQSAPPTQSTFYSGRVALPSLPNVMGRGDSSTAKRPTGNVPPTPTRLTQRMNPSAPTLHVEGARSPMASTEHANGDKAAFLAPFAMFYDSLNDAKKLKTWLGEQLQRSNSLYQNLSQQQDRIQDTVESIVDRRLSSMHNELSALRRRVLELEDALRDAQSGRRGSVDVGPLYHTKSLQNGYSSTHLAPDSYTFPPSTSDHSRLRSDLSGRVSSPRGHERDGRGMQHEIERDSSAPYDSRRSTASALRLEPPRLHHEPPPLPPQGSHTRMSHTMQSPPQMYRDSPPGHHSLPPPPLPQAKGSRGGYSERPPLSRQPSQGGSQDRDRDRDHGEGPVPSRRAGSRRNSIDQRMEDS
ncbi:hypothetical protein NMY22_g3466 [Coprinellus aureogranulatus]|nr:hypothetical protein NMY22_g3466 [Coprinellus aureogranulatus]